MLSFHMLWSGLRIITIEVGVGGSVYSSLAVQKLPESGRQFVVRRISTGPESIPAILRHSIVMQMRNTRRLGFMDEIGMPARGSSGLAEVRLPSFFDLKVWPHHGHT